MNAILTSALAFALSLAVVLPTSAQAQMQTTAPAPLDSRRASIAILEPGFAAVEPDTQARALQGELKRLGCLSGEADGVWGEGSKKALKDFARYAKLSIAGDEPTTAVLDVAGAMKARVCPLVCGTGEMIAGGRCVAKPRQVYREPAPERRRYHAERPAPEPRPAFKLCDVGNRQMAAC